MYNGIICSLVGYLWTSNCVWTMEPWVSFPTWKSICCRLMNSQMHYWWWCDDINTNCNNNSPPVWYCFCAKEGNVCNNTHQYNHYTQYKNYRNTKLTVAPLGSSNTLCPVKANLLGWNSAHNHEQWSNANCKGKWAKMLKCGYQSTEVRKKAAYWCLVPYWLTNVCVKAM